jgi:diguanylate cyclase (GGDEF)-like protein
VSKLRAYLAAEDDNERLLQRQMSYLNDDVIDGVTETYSEEFTLSRLDEECVRASCNGTSVAFIRVQFDGLENLQKFYGRETVEGFLRDAADFLRRGVRRLDIVGRLGDTGYGLVLPGTGEQVQVVIERLNSHLSAWLSQESVIRAGVTVLLGSAFYPESGRSAKKLVRHAELSPLRATPRAA